MILVGIANTQRRRDLTGPTQVAKDKEIAPIVGGSEKFRAFIKEELFPEISKRYRTTSEKSFFFHLRKLVSVVLASSLLFLVDVYLFFQTSYFTSIYLSIFTDF